MKKLLWGLLLCSFFLIHPDSTFAETDNQLIPPQEVDNQLVKFVNQCVFAEDQGYSWPRFCAKVNRNPRKNYTILNADKKRDKVKLLLLPNQEIAGVEDPLLFNPDTPSYFYFAWEDRFLLNKKINQITRKQVYLEPQDYIFTLNAVQSRTQERLHIHVSCIKSEVKKKLANPVVLNSYAFTWRPLPVPIKNPYSGESMDFMARKVSRNDVRKGRLHRMIQREVGNRYPNFGIALWPINNHKFLLMITGDPILAAPEKIFSDGNCSEFTRR